MPSAATILLYGRDLLFLETQQLVLESTGFNVWIAMYLTGIERIRQMEWIDLIVLCPALSAEEQVRALALIESKYPLTKVLTLAVGTSDRAVGQPLNQILSAIDKRLQPTSKTRHLIGQQTTHHHIY
jgi:hypothetical protein